MSTVKAPEDYATIREAIDAVAEGGEVIVSPGAYSEIGLSIRRNEV